jgi:two-component system, NtrC family, response regulator AtoC
MGEAFPPSPVEGMPPRNPTVLLVDDDPAVGKVLGALMAQDGISSVTVRSGAEALAQLSQSFFDLVVTDLRMPPGMDGIELLEAVRTTYPEIPVILITAHGTIAVAVEAMKAGAADFVVKPFDRDEILYAVHKALARARAEPEEASRPTPAGERLVAVSSAMQEALALLRRVAPGNATVLLRGESGVGKDVAAHLLHSLSGRAKAPFIKVHCAALPEGLLESELFGYEKGAFTGAVARKPGRVELAEGGTLFLDEIGDLTLAMQVKLLRLLQDRAFELLGSTTTQRADVRFIAATHRDLESRVQSGEFREDLFYRLNVIPVWLPPLRERPEEIEALAAQFCTDFTRGTERAGLQFSPEALKLLRRQRWPGNVRQLQNFVERLTLLSDGPVIGVVEVERELARHLGVAPANTDESPVADAGSFPALDLQRGEAERTALAGALQRAGGNRTMAAKLLGISRRTLYNKFHEHGML